MESSSPVDVWLKRIAMIAGIALLAFLCYYVHSLATLARNVNRTVTKLSADVEQVTNTAARIARQVDRVTEQVERLEEKVRQAVPLEEAESLLGSAAALREPAPGKLAPAAEAEIGYLLGQIYRSDLRFEYDGKDYSALRFHLQLYAKYQAYKHTLTSAEDFIAKIGTQTISGKAYRVLDGGKKELLARWLEAELAKHRSGKAAGTPRD